MDGDCNVRVVASVPVGGLVHPLDRALLDTTSGTLQRQVDSNITIVEIDARQSAEAGQVAPAARDTRP